ncbi:MAG: carboxypeptidase-like regulatory domain-containing protein [Lachnospiraceae bacterium]|nr:carboxypeptidase-like regulatory domain-containing protein [Lachnospiraceae bacterium]
MDNRQDKMTDLDENKELTYKEKRRKKAKEKRQKDQMSVTIFGIVVYSIVLIGVVVLSYIGFKSAIIKGKEKKLAIIQEEKNREEEEKRALEEEERKAREEQEEQERLLEEEKKAEEENGYKDVVFSAIENVSDPGNAPVNSFTFARKSLDDESGKLMDYEVFINPETDEINKVTTRENCGDLYEITDYYYDGGKINYIAQYREDTDEPIDLSSDKVESRFYFSPNGNMVRYIYCESSKATEYSVEDFDLYSEGTIEQYKYMEEMMLETSKSAYKNAMELGEKVTISGYVQDELNCPPPEEAIVKLLDNNGRVVEETTTNGDGFYEFKVDADDTMVYHLEISAREDMVDTRIYGIRAPKGTKTVDVETAYMAYSVYDAIYPCSIFVKDADNSNIALAGATIKFRYGINNRDGETCLTGVLGDAGEIMPALRSGIYTVEISKDGYETCYTSFAVKQDKTAFVAYAVKDVKENSVKCVLSYETTPLDLDLRAFDTYGRNIFRSQNDSVGITAAETISIDELDSGTYTFYCSDYADIASSDMMSYRLSQSGAKMYVYTSEGLEAIYPVPAGHAGVVWRPFEVRNHKIVTINDYYAYIVENSVFRTK